MYRTQVRTVSRTQFFTIYNKVFIIRFSEKLKFSGMSWIYLIIIKYAIMIEWETVVYRSDAIKLWFHFILFYMAILMATFLNFNGNIILVLSSPVCRRLIWDYKGILIFSLKCHYMINGIIRKNIFLGAFLHIPRSLMRPRTHDTVIRLLVSSRLS